MTTTELLTATQYLTFTLGAELFALEISKVREVMDFTPVTRVPRMPAFMRGVINLRGNVVPVVDLRLKFGMPMTEKTVNTRVIVVEMTLDDEKTIVGALADSVQEVTELEADHIEPAPKIGSRLKTDFIKGMGKRNEGFVIFLDVERIFSDEEMSRLQAAL